MDSYSITTSSSSQWIPYGSSNSSDLTCGSYELPFTIETVDYQHVAGVYYRPTNKKEDSIIALLDIRPSFRKDLSSAGEEFGLGHRTYIKECKKYKEAFIATLITREISTYYFKRSSLPIVKAKKIDKLIFNIHKNTLQAWALLENGNITSKG